MKWMIAAFASFALAIFQLVDPDANFHD